MTAARKPNPKVSKPKVDALDIVEEMTQNATLNRFFDNNPEKLSDEDLLDLIATNRRSRAHNVEKEED
jgi:hypothetical protein